jgi:hypothetical protein
LEQDFQVPDQACWRFVENSGWTFKCLTTLAIIWNTWLLTDDVQRFNDSLGHWNYFNMANYEHPDPSFQPDESKAMWLADECRFVIVDGYNRHGVSSKFVKHLCLVSQNENL